MRNECAARSDRMRSTDYRCALCGRMNAHPTHYGLKNPDVDKERMEQHGMCYEYRTGAVGREPK